MLINHLQNIKPLPLQIERLTVTKYTKHYYIGSERVASALGHTKQVGMLCEQIGIPEPEVINRMNQKVIDAGEALNVIYDAFGKDLVLGQPLFYGREVEFICGDHDPDKYAAFWYHLDIPVILTPHSGHTDPSRFLGQKDKNVTNLQFFS